MTCQKTTGAVAAIGASPSLSGPSACAGSGVLPEATTVADLAAAPSVVGLTGDEAKTAVKAARYQVEWDAGDQTVIVTRNWTVLAQQTDGNVITLTVQKTKDLPPPSAAPTTEAVPSAAAAPAEPQLTVGEQNARSKAQHYLKYTAFSRTGLIDQLVYEGFSVRDGTFGLDSLRVDWNAEAVKKAADYLKSDAFSHSALVDQLVYEGFTFQQAEYGVSRNSL